MKREIGTPGHFICARQCCFRRHTNVDGKYRVSTVGCYHPSGDFDTEPVTVGPDRLYETMVFHLADDGNPVSWTEIDWDRYDTADAADAGHESMVAKYEISNDPRLNDSERAATVGQLESLTGRKWE